MTCYPGRMIFLVTFLVLILVCLLVGACWVAFRLLRWVERVQSTLQSTAESAVQNAATAQAALPGQWQAILDSLGGFIKGHNESFDSTMKAVLAPISLPGQPGAQDRGYAMPVMETGGMTEGTWDHTDLVEGDRLWPPPIGSRTDPGYEFEAEPGFDPNNPLGIPGLTSPDAMMANGGR